MQGIMFPGFEIVKQIWRPDSWTVRKPEPSRFSKKMQRNREYGDGSDKLEFFGFIKS